MSTISQRKIREFLLSTHTASTTSEKGKNLEELICYIFEKISGITVTARDENNVFHSEEIDIVFWNERRRNVLDFLPNLIFVECKNWSARTGSSEIREFDSKLRGKGLSFGIMVAANGVTGNRRDRTSAHHVIDRALSEQRRIIVLTVLEIKRLRDSRQLVRLIKEKLCQLYVSVNVLY